MVDTMQIPQELLFYDREYESAKTLEDFVDCADLEREFGAYFSQYLTTQNDELYKNLDDIIKSFYKRALPVIFDLYKSEIAKHEGKLQSYTEEKNNLNRVQRKFEHNGLKISDYKEIFDDLNKIINEIEIKRSIEKHDLWSKLFWFAVGAIVGLIPTGLHLIGWINF
jgi:hypothetical protein